MQAGSETGTVTGAAEGLTAQTWINNLTLRWPDHRTYVLLFFRSPRPADYDASSSEAVEKLKSAVLSLNWIATSRRDVLVLGVTTDSEEQIGRFLERLRPRFAIGVRSIAYRKFDIKEFPAVLVLRKPPDQPSGADGWVADRITQFDRIADHLAPPPETSSDDDVPLEELPNEVLMERLRSNPYAAMGETLEDSLELLRFRMDPQNFMRFCDEIEYAAGYSSVWLGSVRYQRHLADPAITEKQSDETASKAALARRRASPDAPEWQPYRSFMEELNTLAEQPAEELMSFYKKHLGNDPNDVLIRHRFAHYLSHQHQERLLAPFKAMFEIEPDPVIRNLIVLGISENAPPGDPETLRFLEKKLETETNIRWTRPTLEMAIQWFKEGTNNTN